VISVGLAGKFIGRIDKIINASFSQVRVGDFVNAVRYPVDYQGFGPVVPERTVDLIVLCID
jgi:hypothetical protein